MATHEWAKSPLGHGEAMYIRCFITNREAAVLGLLNDCERAEPRVEPGTTLPTEEGQGNG